MRTGGAVPRKRSPGSAKRGLVLAGQGRLCRGPTRASRTRSPWPRRGSLTGVVTAASGGGQVRGPGEAHRPALRKAPPTTPQSPAPRHPWAVHVLTAAAGLRPGWARRRRRRRRTRRRRRKASLAAACSPPAAPKRRGLSPPSRPAPHPVPAAARRCPGVSAVTRGRARRGCRQRRAGGSALALSERSEERGSERLGEGRRQDGSRPPARPGPGPCPCPGSIPLSGRGSAEGKARVAGRRGAPLFTVQETSASCPGAATPCTERPLR